MRNSAIPHGNGLFFKTGDSPHSSLCKVSPATINHLKLLSTAAAFSSLSMALQIQHFSQVPDYIHDLWKGMRNSCSTRWGNGQKSVRTCKYSTDNVNIIGGSNRFVGTGVRVPKF